MSVLITNTWALRMLWSKGGVPWAVNVLHCIPKDPLTVLDQAKVDKVRSDLQADAPFKSWFSYVHTSVALQAIGLRSLDKPNQAEYQSAVGIVGTNATNPLPAQVAACITLRTALAGRRYRGRVYLGGYTAASLSPTGGMGTDVGKWSADHIVQLQRILDSNGLTLSVASKMTGKSEPVTGILSRDDQWETQRRRLTGGAY